jgi:hypothetical protein
MSRKTNRLRSRIRKLEQVVRVAESVASSLAARANWLERKLAEEAALTIKLADTPAGVFVRGQRFRIDFTVDAFEYDYLRVSRGGFDGQSIDGYAFGIAEQVAERVARVIADHIAGKIGNGRLATR